MANIYKIGQVARVTKTFTNALGANTDPTTVTCIVEMPNGVELTYTWALGTVTRSAEGIFYKNISLTMKGDWFYRIEGTGEVEDADEAFLVVEESEFY